MVPGRLVVRTACTLDCPDTCSLDVTVQDNVIVDIDAATTGDINGFTADFICRKVKQSVKRVHSDARLTTPLIRTGPKGSGQFRTASWDEAIELIATKTKTAITEHGVDSVFGYLYNSSSGVLESSGAMVELFARLGCPEIEHNICAATFGAAWQQVYPGMDAADPMHMEFSQLVVIWGANPTVSNTHLLPVLTECQARGGTVVVIDPRRTGVAERADMHVPLLPGTDAVLALAITHELERRQVLNTGFIAQHTSGADQFLDAAREWTLEAAALECGLDENIIVALVDLIAKKSPAMLRVGWGIERNRNGGSGMLAVLGLWALAGHFGQRGSGIVASTSATSQEPMMQKIPVVQSSRTKINMNHVARYLLGDVDGQTRVKVFVVQGANPAVTAPDQHRITRALEQENLFTVVHDQVLTDTAMYADVVLPATTQFEVDDFAASYGTFTLQRVRKVIEPVGESRSNTNLALSLAAAMGIKLLTPTADEFGISDIVTLRSGDEPIQFKTTFPTQSRAVLFDESSELALPAPRRITQDINYPLIMLSPATSRTVNSMFAEFDPPDSVVTINPEDASLRHITTGTRVTVHNALGVVALDCVVSDRVRRGTCEIPKGLWRRHTESGNVSNALISDDINDLAGGACFNEARVQITKE